MAATFFGEINELHSNAVWYSDEEDEEEDVDIGLGISPKDQERIDRCVHLTVQEDDELWRIGFKRCFISLSSQSGLNGSKIRSSKDLRHSGTFGSFGKLYTFHSQDDLKERCLWIVIDSTHEFISTHLVCYFVNNFLKEVSKIPGLEREAPLIILSKQFSENRNIEYLSNDRSLRIPFSGKPSIAPSLISNPFEAALFELSILRFKPAIIARLPSPRACHFDNDKIWPSVPGAIFAHRLHDTTVEGNLIYM